MIDKELCGLARQFLGGAALGEEMQSHFAEWDEKYETAGRRSIKWAEGAIFSEAQFAALLDLARGGIRRLVEIQRVAIG